MKTGFIAFAVVFCSTTQCYCAERAGGYRGIWYANQATGDEYRFKYSGGFATYPQQHVPIAIYNAAANKTFFCYGGSTGKPKELACMVSFFDHATGTVPRPSVVIVKHTDDAHENPTISLDDAGHLWVFCNTHGPANNSYIFRSKAPYSIDEFEQVARTNFSYSQPWFVPGRGFFFLHTRYDQGRRFLHWMTSADGYAWSEPTLLAAVEMGHYQISNRQGERIITAFNYHPLKGGLNARTNLYYLETSDFGRTWRTAAGKSVTTPIREKRNEALVFDYETEGKLVYLKDINFDAAGRPVVLYLTSKGFEPGPANGPREWFIAHWNGETWERTPFTTTDHNYDFGSLYIEEKLWRIIAPTDPGPQSGGWGRAEGERPATRQLTSRTGGSLRSTPGTPSLLYGAGGEMVMWTSTDEGRTWQKVKQLTHDSKLSHTYARRPVDANPAFYALWADGNPLERSESRLYFTDREGTQVWRLPAHMAHDFERPEIAW
ncbi:MAG: BNR-4 repeat-containing protein [Pirellulales bacterium]